MPITRENSFKMHQSIKSYGQDKSWTTIWQFPMYFEPILGQTYGIAGAARQHFTYMSSELIFVFWESGGPGEWGQLQS